MKQLEMQYRQELHDRLFHSDVYTLDKARRLTHLVLHLAKYNGRLFDVAPARCFIAIDALIILNSIGNTLNTYFGELNQRDHRTDTTILDGRTVHYTGRLCKLLEGLDHLEPGSFRSEFIEYAYRLVDVWRQIFYLEAQTVDNEDLRNKGLDYHIAERLIGVEKKNIFYWEILAQYPQLAHPNLLETSMDATLYVPNQSVAAHQ